MAKTAICEGCAAEYATDDRKRDTENAAPKVHCAGYGYRVVIAS